MLPPADTRRRTRQRFAGEPMRVRCPAKVNLSLRIVGRRADGYHLVDSVMVPVDLCDDIQLAVERGSPLQVSVSCSDPRLPVDEDNLAGKAALIFARAAKFEGHVDIRICKRIPSGAGLGGGSSNAAAVLKSLRDVLAPRFSAARLADLATRIGADVPFFLSCRPARARGIGDLLTTLRSLPSRWLVIVVPPFEVSTAWAYRQFDAQRPDRQGPSAVPAADPDRWPPVMLYVNDLERTVFTAYPVLCSIKQELQRSGAEAALMSGSGSAVFGVFSTKGAAERAASLVAARGQVFVTRSLSGPPVDVTGQKC